MTSETIGYMPLPVVCKDCVNQLIADATLNPAQTCVSVWCPHHEGALITGQIASMKSERVIYCWTISGPMPEEEAIAALDDMAKRHGFEAVINHGSQKVN